MQAPSKTFFGSPRNGSARKNPEVPRCGKIFPRCGSSGFFTTEDTEQQSRNQIFRAINARGAGDAKDANADPNSRFSRRGAETRRSFRWAMRLDANAFPPCGSSRFPTVPIPISIHFSQRTQRAQRSLDDTPGGTICVHLRHLRLKIRNFHGMENVFSNRRNRTQGVAEACRSLRSSRAWRETTAVHFSSYVAEQLMATAS
jgi:hypothetical protein